MHGWWVVAAAVSLGIGGGGEASLDAPPPAGLKKAAGSEARPGPFATEAGPFLQKYCVSCHGAEKPRAGVNLAAFQSEISVQQGRKVWVRVREFVESGEMPPEGKPQPTEAEAARFVGWVKSALSHVDCASQSNPGRVTIRRLNRAEYNDTVRDLVGVDFRPADDFPSDDVGYGFDNIGDVLSLSPILLEKYLDAAERIADEAIVAGASRSSAPVKVWEAEDLPQTAGGNRFKDSGRVLPSNGSISLTYTFPRDAEYVIRVRAFGQQAGPEPTRMTLLLDGKPLRTFVVKAVEKEPRTYEYRGKLRGGSRTLAASFVNDYYNASAPDPSQRDRNLVIDAFEVDGPYHVAGLALPESHKRIVFKKPAAGQESEAAREIIERFATRAYRRPVVPGEVARLVKFVDLARQNGESFERGIQLAVQAVLVSPQFLFRVELDPRPRTRGGQPPSGNDLLISEFELASRLSYFLWSSMPDEELFGLAREGKLRQGDTLEKQVRRMLRDPKSRALVENFAGQWLQTRNLRTLNPDRGRFPDFDDSLRDAMARETELFFEAVMREDRSVLDLLDGDFTYVNERLARHYGLPNVKGDQFRRVSLRGTPRAGILTQASVLTVTSNPTRTSPVKRGKWVLEQILGTPPPPPPGDVPLLKDDRGGPLQGTLRQRMEQHRANPSCASCHARMDPIGFGLENFDAIGAWRDKDGDAPVDPSGTLPSGQSFRGPAELRAILKARQTEFTRNLAEKMLTYATGRGLEYYDSCALDRVVEVTARDGHKFSRLVLEVVRSDPFQKRKGRENVR